jgi:hypothetical protein
MDNIEPVMKEIMQLFKEEDTARELAVMRCVFRFNDEMIRTSPNGFRASC